MRVSSLDQIVRGLLLQEGKPLHYYFQYLKYACDALRELHFDTMKSVSTKKLLVNSYKAIDLPCDYVDWTKIGVEVGQFVRPLTSRNSFNRLNNYEDDGTKIPYPTSEEDGRSTSELSSIAWHMVNRNANGEQTGGVFNYNPGLNNVSFKILREREQIQFDSSFDLDYVILEYITDGQDSDAATKVHPYAIKAIESYICWQYKLHSRSYGGGDRQEAEREFNKQHKRLRSRLNDLTLTEIYNAFMQGYSGTYKN
jgi:hypothetical protein